MAILNVNKHDVSAKWLLRRGSIRIYGATLVSDDRGAS